MKSTGNTGKTLSEVGEKVFHALVNPRIPLSDRQEKENLSRGHGEDMES